MVNDSILDSIKILLGLEATNTDFDNELILNINSVFPTLFQIGLLTADNFSITDNTAIWSDLFGVTTNLEDVKKLIYLTTRLSFDPPQNSFLVKSIETQIGELMWRISVTTEG